MFKPLHPKSEFPHSVLKTEFYNRITASDDRSAGSRIEERHLLALKGRPTKKLEHELLPHKFQPSLQHPAGLPLPLTGREGTLEF